MLSQAMLINKILDTKDYSIISLNNLNDSYFFNYKSEFNFIKNHFDQYKCVPDKVTFVNTFPDFELLEVNEPINYLLEKLFEDYNSSYLASRFNTIKQLLESGDTQSALDYFIKSNENLHIGSSMTCTNLLTDTSRYDRYLNSKNNYISTGFKELDKLIGGIDCENENFVIAARTGIGKCLAKGTKILMADGTTKVVEDVIPGDQVQSLNRINTVLGLHNGVSNGYQIIPTKGEPFTVSANHILTLYKYNEVYDEAARKSRIQGGSIVDIMIEDFLKLSKHEQHLYKLTRPAVEYSEKEQKIPAYILGLWLGDGTSKYAQICTADKEVIEAIQDYCIKSNQECRLLELQDKPHSKAHVYSICGEFQTLLRTYDLINNKHIPLNYLTGSTKQRLDLLAGILDTDSCLLSSGLFDFTQKNKTLFDQTAQLARGLGFKVCIQKPKVFKDINYYRMTISGNLSKIPTKIARKQAPEKIKIVSTNVGFSIKPVDKVEYYGFMCDGDHRYLLADNTLTHNTWTLIKMAVAASLQHRNVGIYSGEMTADKVGYRVDTLLGHINNKGIVRGDLSYNGQYKSYIDSLATRDIGPIKVITPNDINGPATVDALRAFIEREHIDILFIDQYSLLEDTSHAKAPYERVANISKAIKNLQVMKRIPIISVCQMNRTKNEDGEQDTTQIGLSDRIGQDATVVIMLSRDEIKPEEGEVPTNKIPEQKLIINIVKARDGGDGRKLEYSADFNTGEFRYLPNDRDGVTTQEDLESLGNSYNAIEASYT